MKQNVYIFVTFACTMHCPRCYQKVLKGSSKYMLAETTFKEIVRRLIALDIRVRECVFTGGEPAIWPYLPKAIARMKQIAKKVRVVTNGFRQKLSIYNNADIIQITDYGAVNRMDYYRLKKKARRRVRLQSAVHWDWDMNKESPLPGVCGCAGLSFVGGNVWPCAMAAAAQTDTGISIQDDFSRLVNESVHYQNFCKTCLVNRKNRQAPKPVVQISLWESKSWIFGYQISNS